MKIQNLEQTILNRKSIRTFKNEAVSSEHLVEIEQYLQWQLQDQTFSKTYNIDLIDKQELTADIKLGTYGIIKGGRYFLILSGKLDDGSKQQLGYIGEKVVLKIHSLGLGSVWLGGSYNRGDFKKVIDIKDDYQVQLVIPFGVIDNNKHLLGKLAGSISHSRMPLNKIAFIGSELMDINTLDNDVYQAALKQLQLAPSGANRQPWRVVVIDDTFHFYNTKGLSPQTDLGIGFAHFQLWLEDCGYMGEVSKQENDYLANYQFSYQVTPSSI